MPIIRHTDYSSVSELLDATPESGMLRGNRNVFQSSLAYGQRHSLSWFGVQGGYAGVQRCIREGWREGVERLESALQGLESPPVPMSVRRRQSRSDMGDEVSMPHVWRGDLQHAWSRCAPRNTRAPRRVTIVAQTLENCNVDASELFWRGAACVKLCDLLTEAGYSVEIIASGHSARAYLNGDAFSMRVTVKAFSAPLDKSALASTVCLAGFMRGPGFAAICSVQMPVVYSLGQARNVELREGEIGELQKCRDANSARAWIVAALEQIEGDMS
jgi:hypothetical protein